MITKKNLAKTQLKLQKEDTSNNPQTALDRLKANSSRLKKVMKTLGYSFLISTTAFSSVASAESLQLSGLSHAKWKTKQIPVCWENPSSNNQDGRNWTRDAVEDTWQQHSQLEFIGWQECASDSKGIRMLIDDDGPHVKGLGNQLDGLRNGMVLNFTFDNWGKSCNRTLEYCIKTIAVHEFGHALGFAHEQNRADAPLECQKERQGTDGNVNLSTYDPTSVMNYCNPDWSGHGKLSNKDIEGLQRWYGKPDISKRHVDWNINLGDRIQSHREMPEGSYLQSKDGRFKMVVQGDGNLVIYQLDRPIWASNTSGKGYPEFKLAIQSDGNLVMYGMNSSIWASNTNGVGTGLYTLVMQNDGNLVLYDQNSPIWASGTCCR